VSEIPRELSALARQVYNEDVSARFGPRGAAWWSLIFDLVLSEENGARTLGLRMLVKAWEEQEAKVARLEGELARPRRRWWQRSKGGD
jgi:hypothetical protein